MEPGHPGGGLAYARRSRNPPDRPQLRRPVVYGSAGRLSRGCCHRGSRCWSGRSGTRRPADGTAAAGAKVTHYLASLLALRDARTRGAQEALIVDAHGNVVEGATSNVFVVEAGRVATPPESAGILAGITRARLLALARDLGVPVDERELPLENLYGADEVFITSSIREVLSVVRVDGRPVGAGVPGPVARALHRRFRESVGMGDRPMPWEASG
jgi:branched-chain amino acid aminotransferase